MPGFSGGLSIKFWNIYEKNDLKLVYKMLRTEEIWLKIIFDYIISQKDIVHISHTNYWFRTLVLKYYTHPIWIDFDDNNRCILRFDLLSHWKLSHTVIVQYWMAVPMNTHFSIINLVLLNGTIVKSLKFKKINSSSFDFRSYYYGNLLLSNQTEMVSNPYGYIKVQDCSRYKIIHMYIPETGDFLYCPIRQKLQNMLPTEYTRDNFFLFTAWSCWLSDNKAMFKEMGFCGDHLRQLFKKYQILAMMKTKTKVEILDKYTQDIHNYLSTPVGNVIVLSLFPNNHNLSVSTIQKIIEINRLYR